MALTTTFKKSVPYNTVRLAGDVAQWAQTEQTYANNTTLPPLASMGNVSMADLQKASGANIDPGDGVMISGSLGSMRYGISVLADVSAGDGVYDYQVGGTNADFVGTRSYNLAGVIQNVRLSRLARWDYTANLEMPDIDKFDITSSTSADWRSTSIGAELFKDQPMWAFGARDSANTSSRKVYLVRSHPNGGRYSSYAVTNRLVVSHVSDMNDIQVVAPLRSQYGTTLGTNIRSYATFGRRTSSTGNVKAALYNLNISATSWSSSSSTTANITTQFGSNSTVWGGCYLRDDLVAIIASRGAAGRDLIRVSTTGGTISSSRIALTTATCYGTGCDVISIKDEEGSTPLAFAIWTETRSTYNQYVKMRGYNMNSGITAFGNNTLDVFNVSNTFKACGGALLKAGSNSASDPHVFLVWATDTSGDVRLQVVAMGNGTLSITGLPSTTIQYNDSNVESFVTISPLSAVEKTNITTSGEAFVPGGTNNFKKRRYFSISVSTNQSTDSCALYYGYYDMDSTSLVVWDGGNFTGREMKLARSYYDTDGRQYAKDLYYRAEAGAVWMPFLGGRYLSSTDRRLTFGMASLDYKPNWSGLNGADPGGTVYLQGGEIGTTGAYFNTAAGGADFDITGRWYVLGPHPLYPGNISSLIRFYDAYNSNSSFSDGIGPNLSYFVMRATDIDNNNWGSFFTNTLIPFSKNNNVYIEIKTGAAPLRATYTLPASLKGPFVSNGYIVVPWYGQSNSHAGDSWGWLWNTTTGETKNAVGITFSETAFK